MQCRRSEELAKLIDRKAGIAHDTAHGIGIDGVMSWNRHDVHTISHDDMFTLPRDPQASLFQRPNRIAMVYTRELRHD